MCKKREDKYTT